MILEVIILAGTFAAEEVCATTLLESGIIKHVIDHLNGEYLKKILFALCYIFFINTISYIYIYLMLFNTDLNIIHFGSQRF